MNLDGVNGFLHAITHQLSSLLPLFSSSLFTLQHTYLLVMAALFFRSTSCPSFLTARRRGGGKDRHSFSPVAPLHSFVSPFHLTDTHIPIPPAVNSFPAVGINGLFSPFPAVFTVNGHSLYAVRSFL